MSRSVRSGGALSRGQCNSISLGLAFCAALYIVTNLLLTNRSDELGHRATRERTAAGRLPTIGDKDDEENEEKDEDGWWLPLPIAFETPDTELHIRRLLGHDRSANQSLLRRLTSSHLKRILERSSRCEQVRRIMNLTYLASGWTKAVYSGRYDDSDVAVKMADRQGYDVRRCLKTEEMTAKKCLRRVHDKILKEAFILQVLDSPHIVKLIDICLPLSESHNQPDSSAAAAGPTLVVELGEMADIIKLLQMSWEDRLRLSLGLTELLHYVARTAYGSVVINDFRRQQFVIIDGQLKLIDVDDVGFDEMTCSRATDCTDQLPTNSTAAVQLDCVAGRCVGLNEMKNIVNAGRHFMSVLLPHGAPMLLRPLVNEIIEAFDSASLRTHELLALLKRLVHLYSTGFYLQRGVEPVQTSYKEMAESDLPGQYDYRCLYSIATSGCTVTVFDQKEAEDLCDYDPQCTAFVLSSQKSWTGRLFAHLKNNASIPTHRVGTTLYVRQQHS